MGTEGLRGREDFSNEKGISSGNQKEVLCQIVRQLRQVRGYVW